MARLTLKQIAEHFQCSPKTFARQVRKDNIPYLPRGRHMSFDLIEVEAYLRSLLPENNKVLKFQPKGIKSRTHKSKFAEAVGL